MRIDVITLFPTLIEGALPLGVLGRAQETGRVEVRTTDPRSFTTDRHKTVDDRPYGGGEGMVLKPEPLFAAVESLHLPAKTDRDPVRQQVVMLSPQGEVYTQRLAREFASLEQLVLLCGRYEGVDERVIEGLCDREVSIGDYVLSGGELAASVIIDSVVRLLPGVLGNPDSAHHESFGVAESASSEGAPPRSTHGTGGLLDYPHYTRPPSFAGRSIPDVLASGDHLAIRRWRRRMSLRKTLLQRPDLLAQAELSRQDEATLQELRREIEAEQRSAADPDGPVRQRE